MKNENLGVKALSDQGSSIVKKTLRCPTCGAPMTPSAESILTICGFCGEIVAESHITPHAIIKPKQLIPPPGPGQIRKMELILVPFFEVKADVDVEALGYQRRERTETRTVRRGGQTYTESKTIVEYRPWRIEHHGSHSVRFLARQEITMFGANELIASVTRNLGGEPTPFSPDYIKALASNDPSRSLVALSPEWDQKDASKEAGEQVYEAAYSLAKSQMHEVFDTRVNFRPLAQPMLIHEPILLIRRKIQGKSYRAAYHWGSGQLLREEQPIKNRGLMLFFATLLFLGAPPLVQVGYTQYQNSGESWYLILLGIVAAVCLGVGIFLIVRAFKPHKVKSSGGKVGLFDFQGLAAEQRAALEQGRKIKQQQQSTGQQPVARFCPKCGDPLDPNQRFCEKCGYQMNGDD